MFFASPSSIQGLATIIPYLLFVPMYLPKFTSLIANLDACLLLERID